MKTKHSFGFPKLPYGRPVRLSLKSQIRILLANMGTGYMKETKRLGPNAIKTTERWILFGVVLYQRTSHDLG
jgi:hypothetical protein